MQDSKLLLCAPVHNSAQTLSPFPISELTNFKCPSEASAVALGIIYCVNLNCHAADKLMNMKLIL